MSTIQTNSDKRNVTSNTTTVWDRIVNLENNVGVGGTPLKNQVDLLSSSLAQSMTVNVVSKGASGNGSDDTTIIQNLINTISDGSTIIGDGKVYTVTGLDIKRSNIKIKNLKLKLKDGDNYWKSPIRIIGTRTNPVKNIELENIQIDGNRTNQSNLRVDVNGNATESRAGIGLYGFISDVTVKRCISQYNAGDGIWLSAGLSTITDGVAQKIDDTQLCINNVKVYDSIFTYNRRHGGALDCSYDIVFQNCIFENNGTDINSGVTNGDKGELYSGAKYGMGFDAESMGAGLNFRDVKFLNCSFQNNSGSALAILNTSSDLSYEPFRQISNIIIDKCVLKGYSPSVVVSTLYITPKTSNVALARKLYNNIKVTNTTIVTGGLDIASAENVFMDNILFQDLTPTNVLNFNSCNNVIISNVPTGEGKLYSDGGGTIITPSQWRMKQTNKIFTVNAYADLANLTTAVRGDIALLALPTDYGIRGWSKTTNGWNILSAGLQAKAGTIPSTTQTRYIEWLAPDGSIMGYIPVYLG